MDNPFGFLNGLYLYGTCFHERGKKMNYDLIDDSNMNRYQKQILAQAKTIQSQRKELQAEREKVKNIEFKLDVFGGNLLLSGERRALEMFREFRQALEKLKESEGKE